MNVRLYGRLADLIGEQVQLDLPAGGCSVADLRTAIGNSYPEAQDQLASGRVRACVNDAIVPDEHVVGPADTVEFFPPVSGG